MRITNRIGIALVAGSAIALAAGSAQAVQFTPTATARMHKIFANPSGTTWNTGAPGTPNGQIAYAAGVLTVTGEIDVINYFDPGNGGCPTDTGSNCTVNVSPNLDLAVVASYLGLTYVDQGFGSYDITLHFGTTGGTDITWTDPTDSTQVLRASWVAGDFLGGPTTGLEVTATYCNGVDGCGAQGLQGNPPTVVGFALIDNSTLYASMFDSGSPMRFALNVDQIFETSPSLDELAQHAFDNQGELLEFTGDGQGQIFRIETGDFVIPEPSTALLIGLGLAAIGALRRRENS